MITKLLCLSVYLCQYTYLSDMENEATCMCWPTYWASTELRTIIIVVTLVTFMYSAEKLTQNLNISVFDSLLFSRSKIDARTFNNDVANGSCMEGGEDSKALRC